MQIALFLVLWLLFTLALRSLALRLKPALGRQRWTFMAAGVLGLALAYPLMQQLTARPAGRSAMEWPEGTRAPLPVALAPATLQRVPFTAIAADDFVGRATFVEAAQRRPVAHMALRLKAESASPVQRYLLLRGDTLQLVVDERRRSDGRGELYGYALEEVRLGTCAEGGRDCAPLSTTSPRGSRAVYRVLGRFPNDTAWAVRF